MKNLKQCYFALLLTASLLSASYAKASEEHSEDHKGMLGPDAVVTKVTSDLMSVAKKGQAQLKEDPEAYYKKVKDALLPAVDFKSIAKSVMGKRYWLAATEQQREKFVDAFTDSLVETYGKGMASFADLDIKVDKTIPHKKNPNVSFVVQSVKTDTGTNKITYTMVNKEGWRLRNVILDGVDLGKTFKSQFSQAVQDNRGSVGITIAKWGEKEESPRK